MFQRFPGDFQHQPLLWVKLQGFTRGNAEKARVKGINVLMEKTTVAGVDFALALGIGIVKGLDIPAVCRYFADTVHAVAQHAPIGFRAVSAAGKAAAEADNGDRLGSGVL